MSEIWYYQVFGMEFGPADTEELCRLATSGILGPDDLVRRGTTGEWRAGRDAFGPFAALERSGGKNASTKTSLHANFLPAGSPDEQVATSQQPTQREAHHSISADVDWYVFVSGREFGPLTTDDLVQIVQKGAVSAHDLVRTANSLDWSRADSIVGLFNANGSPAAVDSQSRPQALIRTRPQSQSEGANKKDASRCRHAMAKWQSANAAEVARNWLAQIHRRRLKPKPSRPPNTAGNPSAVSKTLLKSANNLKVRVELLWECGVDLLLQWLEALWRMFESKKALGLVTFAVIVVAAALLMVPWRLSSSESAYEAYIAVVGELRQMRARKADTDEWNMFAVAAEERLQPIVARLEKSAEAADRESLSLLWIGRDFLPHMLDDSREAPSESERNVELHLRAVRKYVIERQHRRTTRKTSASTVATTVLVVVNACVFLSGLYWLGTVVLRAKDQAGLRSAEKGHIGRM